MVYDLKIMNNNTKHKFKDDLFCDNNKRENSINLNRWDAQSQEPNLIMRSEIITNEYKPFIYLENNDINTLKNLIKKLRIKILTIIT